MEAKGGSAGFPKGPCTHRVHTLALKSHRVPPFGRMDP